MGLVRSSQRELYAVLITLVTLIGATAWSLGYLYGLSSRPEEVPPVSTFTYLVFKEGSVTYAKNGLTGRIDFIGTNTSQVISSALNALPSTGGNLFIKNVGVPYILPSDIAISDKSYVTIESDGAEISGGRFKVMGTKWSLNKFMTFRGLNFTGAGGGIGIENTYDAKVEDCHFMKNDVGLEIRNTREWSEFLMVSRCQFDYCGIGIAFRTPIAPGTDSYANSELSHLGLNIGGMQRGILVESGANVAESTWMDLRFWFHGNLSTGIEMAGNFTRCRIVRPTFESFVKSPSQVYAMDISTSTWIAAPALDEPSFLGEFDRSLHNPYYQYIGAVGQTIKRTDESVSIGFGTYGPAKNFSGLPVFFVNPRIKVVIGGTLGTGEIVSLKVEFFYLDEFTPVLEKTYNFTGSEWFTDDDYFSLSAVSNALLAMRFYAKTNKGSTSATLAVSFYANGV
jgi:hypothetical protein